MTRERIYLYMIISTRGNGPDHIDASGRDARKDSKAGGRTLPAAGRRAAIMGY